MARTGNADGSRAARLAATPRDPVEQMAAEFERLYRGSYSLVYNYVYRALKDPHLTEDVVSEAFLRAARFFPRFDPARAKFSTWVVSIARNCIAGHFRAEARGMLADEPPGDVPDCGHDEIEGVLDADAVERLLAVLSAEEREVVALKYFGGMRNTEIALELGMNQSTVSTRLQRALSKMRAAWERGA